MPETALSGPDRAPAVTLSQPPADPVGDALAAALEAWHAGGDAPALRRALLRLLAELG